MSEPTRSAISPITLLTPLPGRVVLRRTEPAAAPSPYVIPDQAKEKPVEAVVVAIPRLPYYEYGVLIPCPVNEGDLCLVGKYAGDHRFRGEDVTIVRWDEILAVISKPAASAEEAAAGKPSAADLDVVADERRAEELTSHFLNKIAREGGQQSVDNPPDRAVPRL